MIGDRPDEPVTQYLTRASQHLTKAFSATSYTPLQRQIAHLQLALTQLITRTRARHTDLTTTRSLFPPARRPRNRP